MKRRGLWLAALALALLAMAGAPTASAQEASFDCLQADRPIERLICSDPQLMELDGALGAAFVAWRQRLPAKDREAALVVRRAWLAKRLTAGGTGPFLYRVFPAGGGRARPPPLLRCRHRPPSPRSRDSCTRPACGA